MEILFTDFLGQMERRQAVEHAAHFIAKASMRATFVNCQPTTSHPRWIFPTLNRDCRLQRHGVSAYRKTLSIKRSRTAEVYEISGNGKASTRPGALVSSWTVAEAFLASL